MEEVNKPAIPSPPEFMAGTEPGSQFLVIAKKNGISLGVRPLVGIVPPGIPYVKFRVRAQVVGENSVASMIESVFPGFPWEPKETGQHMSFIMGYVVASRIVGTPEVWKIINDNDLVTKMLSAIGGNIEAEALIETPERVREWVLMKLEDSCPTTVDIPEFGEPAMGSSAFQSLLANALQGKKKAAQTKEEPKGDEDAAA